MSGWSEANLPKAWDQPPCGKRRRCRDRQHADPPLASDSLAGEKHAVEARPHSVKQHSTVAAQLDPAMQTSEQRGSEMIFEGANLMAYRALGQRKLVRRTGEGQVSGDGLEGPQGSERR